MNIVFQKIHATGFSPISHHFSLYSFTIPSYFFSNLILLYKEFFSDSKIVFDDVKCKYPFSEIITESATYKHYGYNKIGLLYGKKKLRDFLMKIVNKDRDLKLRYKQLKSDLDNFISLLYQESCIDKKGFYFEVYPIITADCGIDFIILNFVPRTDFLCIYRYSRWFIFPIKWR